MCKKMMYSDYYEQTFTRDQVEIALDLYIKWCEENDITPEVENINDVSNTGVLDHVLYHAEFQGYVIN